MFTVLFLSLRLWSSLFYFPQLIRQATPMCDFPTKKALVCTNIGSCFIKILLGAVLFSTKSTVESLCTVDFECTALE